MTFHPCPPDKAVILMRASLAEEEELFQAKKYFHVIESRTALTFGVRPRVVVPRYSALPYYQELEIDVNILGSRLINSYTQHRFVANLWNWYKVLEGLTPKTYQVSDIPHLPEGAYVLKGETNSRKALWNTSMFAPTKQEIGKVLGRLYDDTTIGSQDVYIREYVPLVKLATGENGLPISMEFRFFILDGVVLAGGFYWSSHTDIIPIAPATDIVDKAFLDAVIKKVGDSIRFYVIDIALTSAGDWIVVELNDGSQSGTSCIDLDELYKSLAARLTSATSACTRCKEFKDEAEFCHRTSGRVDRICRTCVNLYTNQRRAADPAIMKNDNAKHTAKQRELVRAFKTGKPCADCGISFENCAMDFDHLDPNTKKFVISQAVGRGVGITALELEMSKCELVCSNCHRIRTYRAKQHGTEYKNRELSAKGKKYPRKMKFERDPVDK